MNAGLNGKVAVITGSTGGLGEGIARRLASEGMAVVVSGRRVDVGERVAREIREDGGRATFVRADVVVEEDCVNLIQTALGRFGHLDVLVNNAVITPVPVIPLEEQSAETWDQEFAVNLRGAFLCCREAIPPMRERGGGCIINIGTTTVYQGTAADLKRLAYVCSKGALLTMTKTMARALLHDRIRVNWVTVGWVATPTEVALRDRTHGDGLTYLRERGEKAPLGRLETVDDIAAGVAYLVSDQASHVTGCELNVSGGLWV